MTSAQSTKTRSPRFRQIVDCLRAPILEGALPAHAALPSERGVAREYNVSRMTARRALEAIEAEGLAYSEDRRGRFVSPQRLKYDVSKMISLAAVSQASGTKLEIEVIEAKEIKADAQLAKSLSVNMGEALYGYTRLFRSNGHAIFIETEWVVASQFPDLLNHDLRQSTTRLLEQNYNTYAHSGDILIRMRAVLADESKLLGLTPNHPGIELEQVICDDAGRPFCIGRQIWRGELAEFSARAIVNPQEPGRMKHSG
ncbi:MAG: GntR family transcriptional regulator [Rhodobacteraceae bacterium]|nr:GntR family transcriptional regulator [Paracoccaceae bacterium]